MASVDDLIKEFGGTIEPKKPTDFDQLIEETGGQVVESAQPTEQLQDEPLIQTVESPEEPETDLAGVAGAITRGLALPAAGAAAGAVAGAPIAGVGAIPGAAAGFTAATLTQLLGDPIVALTNSLFGTEFTAPTDALRDLLTRAGVAEPDTELERIIQSTAEGAAGAGGTVALGRTLQAGGGDLARRVGQTLAQQPVAQTVAGATSAGATKTAEEAGAGPAGQIAAGLAGGAAPSLVASLAARSAARQTPSVIRSATQDVVEEAAEIPEDQFRALVRNAAKGPNKARDELANLASVNPAAKEAAENLNLDLPVDVFSDNPQVRRAVGLTRSVVASPEEAAWIKTLRDATKQADEVIKDFDAIFVEGTPAPGAASTRVLDALQDQQKSLQASAKTAFKSVDDVIQKTTPSSISRIKATLSKVVEEVGEDGLSAQEKRLLRLVDTDEPVTYGRMLREKNLVGKAIEGKESPYSNMALGDLKRLYSALAEDQLDTAAQVGGEELRKQLRGANLLVAQRKGLEKRIINAFGKELDGSVGNLIRTAITSAGRGDAKQFNKLMKAVPKDLRKEVIATGLASASATGRGAFDGSFGFDEYAKLYKGLRANPGVYKQVVDELGGPQADKIMRDLFEVSKRVTDARANVLPTGKANQALKDWAQADGLVGKIMQNAIAQRSATAAAGLIPGGGFVAPDIVQFMSKAESDAIKAASKVFSDPSFKDLAVDAATKVDIPQSSLNKVATSKAFARYANKFNLPKTIDGRAAWLQSAIQTGRQVNKEEEENELN